MMYDFTVKKKIKFFINLSSVFVNNLLMGNYLFSGLFVLFLWLTIKDFYFDSKKDDNTSSEVKKEIPNVHFKNILTGPTIHIKYW